MKNNKSLFYAVLSLLSISSLVACGGSGNTPNNGSRNSGGQEDEERELEIGDTVKEWVSSSDYDELPLDVPEGGTGTREIVKDFGNEDQESLHYSVKSSSGYLTTAVSEPYFSEFDAKNGDIISLYVYIPSNSNLSSLQIEARATSNSDNSFKGNKLEVNEDKEEKWIRLECSFNTLSNLDSIRLNFVPVDSNQEAEFYVDDINITLGEEYIKTKYEYNDESLYQTYEDYFIVGTALDDDAIRNSEYRKITKHNFNSVTAENEAKPERVLDQAACQELAKTDETKVAITVKPFERIYDWCEANHIQVRHHTFVWHQQTPNWFFNKGYQNNGEQVSKEVMLKRLDNYLKTMIDTLDERWPGLVYALDIVNEAIEEVDQIRRGNWKSILGDDFIYEAFRAAAKHKKDYQDLYYNDYAFDQEEWGGIERCQWACDKLLKKAIDEGLVDGIGIQGHVEKPKYADAVLESARIICKAGIKCQITELDINVGSNSENDFQTQKELYRKVVGSVLEGNDNGTMDVNAIIVWGITDNESWHRTNYPLMFNEDFSKKPAYYGFLDTLDEYLNGATFSEDSSSD